MGEKFTDTCANNISARAYGGQVDMSILHRHGAVTPISVSRTLSFLHIMMTVNSPLHTPIWSIKLNFGLTKFQDCNLKQEIV